MSKPINRMGTTPIKVRVLPDEKAQIQALAASAGLSASTYLRKVGLGTPVAGIADQEAVRDLVKVAADQGRLGGLLKMWLTNDEKLAANLDGAQDTESQIFDVLREIRAAQAILLQAAQKIV